jgi:hypothetical protein
VGSRAPSITTGRRTEDRRKGRWAGALPPAAPEVYRLKALPGKAPRSGGPRGARVALQRGPILREGRGHSTPSGVKLNGRIKKKDVTGNVSRLRGTWGGF